MSKQTVLEEVEAWPVPERLEFMDLVWDRIADSGWQPTLTDEQKAEFDRRLDALDANPDDIVTWESITQHVKRPR